MYDDRSSEAESEECEDGGVTSARVVKCTGDETKGVMVMDWGISGSEKLIGRRTGMLMVGILELHFEER